MVSVDFVTTRDGNLKVIHFYIYTSESYEIYYSQGVKDPGNQNIVSINPSVEEIEVTIQYLTGSMGTEVFTVRVDEKVVTLPFTLSYGMEKDRDHLYVVRYPMKFFPSWSTAGRSIFSLASKVIGTLLLGQFGSMARKTIETVSAMQIAPFPLEKDKVRKSDTREGKSLGSVETVVFSHISKFEEVEPRVRLLEERYGRGGDLIFSQGRRGEIIAGDKEKLYSSLVLYNTHTYGSKIGRGAINHQMLGQFVTGRGLPISASFDEQIVTISDSLEEIEFFSPVVVEQLIVSQFGDIFILGDDGGIYYGKTDVYLPDPRKINPSINNNNIIELSSELFTPTKDIELVVSIEELRKLGASYARVEIETGGTKVYLSDDEEVSSSPINISLNDRDGFLRLMMETGPEDKDLLVSVYVNSVETPYIAYASSLSLSLIKTVENPGLPLYADMYVRGNDVIGLRHESLSNVTGPRKEYRIKGQYMETVKAGDEYVHYEA